MDGEKTDGGGVITRLHGYSLVQSLHLHVAEIDLVGNGTCYQERRFLLLFNSFWSFKKIETCLGAFSWNLVMRCHVFFSWKKGFLLKF